MSSKYKFSDKLATYFITSTVVGWADVFTRNEYKDILVDSFKHCQVNQGLQIQAWVIMTNHWHMICSFKEGYDPGLVIKNIKSFTALKIIDAIINNPKESRKEWLLQLFESYGKTKKVTISISFFRSCWHPLHGLG